MRRGITDSASLYSPDLMAEHLDLCKEHTGAVSIGDAFVAVDFNGLAYYFVKDYEGLRNKLLNSLYETSI